MRSKLSFMVLAAAIVAGPAFAQTEDPAGQWDGVIVRNGAREPIVVRLGESGDLWKGRLEINGASSPLDSVSVNGNKVHFELPSQGVFDGMFSGDAMTGSISGSKSPGTFALTREESTDEFANPIESEGP